MTDSLSRFISKSLVGISILFALVGLVPLGYSAWVRYTWKPTSGVVTAIRLTSAARSGGVVSIEFRSTHGAAQFTKAVLPGRSDRIMHNYAEGTLHIILLDPKHPGVAELPLDWESLSPSLLPLSIAVFLFLFARRALLR